MTTELPQRLTGLPSRTLPGGLTVVSASTIRSRQRGLGGLAVIPDDLALEIPAYLIHTWTMRFDLDLVWLARDGAIRRVDHAVPRWRMKMCLRAASVLEVSAGQGDRFAAAHGGGGEGGAGPPGG